MTIPLSISARKIGSNFSAAMRQRILDLRVANFDLLQRRLSNLFSPLDNTTFSSGFSVLENVSFGKLSTSNKANSDKLILLVIEVLLDADLKRLIAELSYDIQTGLGGANLFSFDAEHLAFARAAIKMPDILILDKVLASYDPETRLAASIKLRHAMPDATIIYLEEAFLNPQNFDDHIELQKGRIQESEAEEMDEGDDLIVANMNNKVRVFETSGVFSGLD